MRIGERSLQDGSIVPVTLTSSTAPPLLSLWVGAERMGDLPLEALFAVMDRYGKPLDVPAPGGELDLGDGAALSMLRHLARYDVIARDWLVLRRVGKEPVAELAVSVLAALEHLVRATERNVRA